MDQAPAPDGLPPSLRFLKGLVITLTLTMIVGVIVVVAVIVTRMPQMMRSSAPLPAEITLPAGVKAQAVTQGGDWYAIVTTDDRILMFDRASGDLRQEVKISAPSR
ncbi:MAG: DUF6476 family protein [Cereibacter changlensis]